MLHIVSFQYDGSYFPSAFLGEEHIERKSKGSKGTWIRNGDSFLLEHWESIWYKRAKIIYWIGREGEQQNR